MHLYKPKLFIIDLLPFAKLLELLAIDHSSSKRRIIFAPRWLKFSHVLVVLQLAWVRTSPQLSWIAQSGLAPFPGCRFVWHSPKWASRFGCLLQYMSGLEVLACSLDTDLNYVITMLQLHPSLNH